MKILIYVALFAAIAYSRVAHFDDGPVMGVVKTIAGKDVQAYYGVPFAEPPIGELRWARPQRPKPWKSPKLAALSMSMCSQIDIGGLHLGEEDCLYLDVAAPIHRKSKGPLPVMVWIYGGAWEWGYKAGWGEYDVAKFAAEHDVIVVSANYRVDSLGWLAMKELAEEDVDGSTGNYGIMDQGAALEWVQRNIHHLGGDPNSVTIFGESAGAFSVCQHLVRPDSSGLFQRAIMESGSCDSGSLLYQPRADAFKLGEEFAEAVGCGKLMKKLPCLRQLPLSKVMISLHKTFTRHWPYDGTKVPEFLPPYAPALPWGPVVDGSRAGTPREPLNMLQNLSGVELLIGSNQDEGSLFMSLGNLIVPGAFPVKSDRSKAMKVLLHFFHTEELAKSILSFYAKRHWFNYDYDKALSKILGHMIFGCSSRRAARAVSSAGGSAFLYQFDFKMDGGDTHGAELPFLWDFKFSTKSKAEKRMAKTIQSYWVNFAKSGTPYEDNSAVWEKYSESSDLTMILDRHPRMETGVLESACDFWDSVYQTSQ